MPGLRRRIGINSRRGGGSKYFIITIDTTKAGSANDTFVLPLPSSGTYNYDVNWGDGVVEHFEVNTSQTHVYDSSGEYTIKISGIFPQIYFSNGGDKLKLISIDNWGKIVWGSFYNAFLGCANMEGKWKDVPDLSNCTSLQATFSGCSKLNTSINNWDISNATTMLKMFYECSVYNQPVDNLDTSNVTNLRQAFYNVPMRQSFANFNIEKVTDLNNMCINDINKQFAPTQDNYDNTLISWASQNVHSGLVAKFTRSNYGEELVNSGTTDGTTADKLIDSTQNFLTNVTIGDVIYNTTDETFARVTAIDSDTSLSLDNDIMVSGEDYHIQHSNAAKARASLILDDGWTITDAGPLSLITFDKAKFVFTQDDGNDSNYLYMYPLFETKGIKGTFFVITDTVGVSSSTVTWAECIEMATNGHIIGSHGTDHTRLTELNETELNTEFTAIDAAFVANGMPAPDYLAYPFGSVNDLVKSVAANYYNAARQVTNNWLYKDTSLFDLPATTRLDTTLNDTNKLSGIFAQIDQAIAAKTLLIFDGHGVLPDELMDSETEYAIQLSYLEQIVDYLLSKDVDIINIDQLYTLLTT